MHNVVMRSMLLAAVLLLGSRAVAQSPPCTVSETTAPNGTTFMLSGTLRTDETLKCDFSVGLNLQLVAVSNGWQIALHYHNNSTNFLRPEGTEEAERAHPTDFLLPTSTLTDTSHPFQRRYVVMLDMR